MARPSSPVARLTDIIEAIELIRTEMAGVTLAAFEPDRRKRWLVERGIEIISEASRHLSDELKGRHPTIPWSKVAGIGNVLRHEYEDVAHDVLWHVVRDDLPPLEQTCRQELARAQGAKHRRARAQKRWRVSDLLVKEVDQHMLFNSSITR
jgi:uncharacterized protein with HEPN domain